MPFKVFAFGDWGLNSDNKKMVDASMTKYSIDNQPTFMIPLGDNFYEAGVSSIIDPLWKTVMVNCFSNAQLSCPWYPVLGNHDYLQNPDAQVLYKKINLLSRWSMPDRYYTITYLNSTFFLLIQLALLSTQV